MTTIRAAWQNHTTRRKKSAAAQNYTIGKINQSVMAGFREHPDKTIAICSREQSRQRCQNKTISSCFLDVICVACLLSRTVFVFAIPLELLKTNLLDIGELIFSSRNEQLLQANFSYICDKCIYFHITMTIISAVLRCKITPCSLCGIAYQIT